MPDALRLRIAAVTALSAIALLAAAAPANAEQRNVSMVDDRFVPASINVKRGDRITWQNDGLRPHTVTSRTNLFDSGIVLPGKNFTRRFSTAGTYRYHCFLHEGMDGTVVVTAAGRPTPAPTERPAPRPSGGGGQPPDTSMIVTGGADHGGGGSDQLPLLLSAGALGGLVLARRRLRGRWTSRSGRDRP